jgi:hypothetical protein
MGPSDCRGQKARAARAGARLRRMRVTAWHTEMNGKHKRSRQSTQAFARLPALRASQLAVLQRWLKSHAQVRTWQSLLQLAGTDALDWVDGLRDELLAGGALAVKEELKSGQWRVTRIVWRDLPALQQAAGVTTADEHAAHRDDLAAQWLALANEHPWLTGAAQTAAKATAVVQSQRLPLLKALVAWRQAQRTGLRQDFALAAREHTKGITATEWDWLDVHLPLDALGIGRFEPVFWLGGALTLTSEPSGELMSLPRVGFVGLPCRQLNSWSAVQTAPQRYWLIENRASFERQALQLQPGVCLIWLPGRPSESWLQAMRWLLMQAPAPAAISCDPDPAGIQIALTAGQLWDDAGLRWDADQMSSEFWKDGVTRALNDYDRRVLAELQQALRLPASLARLRDDITALGLKAEQEAWI